MSDFRISYPYPVLGNSDDLQGTFEPAMECMPDEDLYTLEIVMGLNHSTVAELIENRDATYAVEIICRKTFYRRTFLTHEPVLLIAIPADELRDLVEVSFDVVAINGATDYLPTGTHPDLAGDPFTLESGDVIATGGTASFVADPAFDPMHASAASFVKIHQVHTQEEAMSVDYEGDFLIIGLSSSAFDDYLKAREFAPEVVHSAVVLPVLVAALEQIDNGEADFAGYGWFDRLQEMRSTRGLTEETPLRAAQDLLGDPVSRCLAGLAGKQSDAEFHDLMGDML